MGQKYEKDERKSKKGKEEKGNEKKVEKVEKVEEKKEDKNDDQFNFEITIRGDRDLLDRIAAQPDYDVRGIDPDMRRKYALEDLRRQ